MTETIEVPEALALQPDFLYAIRGELCVSVELAPASSAPSTPNDSTYNVHQRFWPRYACGRHEVVLRIKRSKVELQHC
jgi:hypothetical protein